MSVLAVYATLLLETPRRDLKAENVRVCCLSISSYDVLAYRVSITLQSSRVARWYHSAESNVSLGHTLGYLGTISGTYVATSTLPHCSQSLLQKDWFQPNLFGKSPYSSGSLIAEFLWSKTDSMTGEQSTIETDTATGARCLGILQESVTRDCLRLGLQTVSDPSSHDFHCIQVHSTHC